MIAKLIAFIKQLFGKKDKWVVDVPKPKLATNRGKITTTCGCEKVASDGRICNQKGAFGKQGWTTKRG